MKKRLISGNILIASGVNLDLLGTREPEFYGKETLGDMEALVRAHWPRIVRENSLENFGIDFFQSNDEAAFLGQVAKGWSGIVLNPGSWTHTSLALADRLAGTSVPFVEVHLSQLHQRDDFRQKSFTAKHALGIVQGFGIFSYVLGLEGLVSKLPKKAKKS